MQLVNLVLLVTSILFIIPYCQGNYDDDPPCTNDDLYGKGNMCYFAFLGEISPNNMVTYWSADAKKFLKGCLRNFTIDFAPDSSGLLVTLVPENGKVVWGYTYLIPADYYQSTLLTNLAREGEDKIFISQRVEIEVIMEGKKQNICGNILVAVNQPKKESCIPPERQPGKSSIDECIRIFTAAHFPPEYIEEFSNISQRFCKRK